LSRRLGWQDYENDGHPPPPAATPAEPAPSPIPWALKAEVGATSGNPTPDTTSGGASAPVPAAAPGDTATVGSPQPESASARTFPIVELLWLCTAVVDALLAFDFLFRALASRNTGFVGAVMQIGDALSRPFRGVLSGRSLPDVDHTSYWQALVAIVIYTLAVALLLQFLRLLARPPHR